MRFSSPHKGKGLGATLLLVVCVGSTACASAAGSSSGGERASAESSTAPSTATAGYYTAAQGSRGATVFTASCGGCHSESEFSGRLFDISWSGKSLFEFYDYIRSAMPYDDPGALTAQEYADIVAFVLQNNGYAAGSSELAPRPEALSAATFN